VSLVTQQAAFPEIFARFGQRGARKQLGKKPKFQKPNFDAARLDPELLPSIRTPDINGCLCPPEIEQDKASEMAILLTRQGQKWVVKRVDVGDGITRLIYCDGSSSLVSQEDVATLGLRFLPLTNT
jgi:hypothetical protein